LRNKLGNWILNFFIVQQTLPKTFFNFAAGQLIALPKLLDAPFLSKGLT